VSNVTISMFYFCIYHPCPYITCYHLLAAAYVSMASVLQMLF